MANRRMYDLDDYRNVQQPRDRAADFDAALNKYCSKFDSRDPLQGYQLLKDNGKYIVIGSGAFGKVYQAEDKYKRPVALKVMWKDHILSNRLEYRVLDEIRIHSMLRHPRVVEMYGCFHDSKRVYIALELCPHGDLEHYLRRGVLSEDMAASIFRQVVEGVLYLHRAKTSRDGSVIGNPILHRDLKPSNICFARDKSVKICDFNLATEVLSDGQKNTTYCGTPGYMPPEIALNLPYSFEVDAYGLGCILYSMLFGGPPGKRPDECSSSKFDVHIPDGVISVEAENLLRNLLCKDGRQRMAVRSVAKDPFLMKYTQRKRVASTDSGFDTQHTGSSFPEPPRRAASRERPLPRPLADVQQCVVPFRRPLPLMPPRPPSIDDVASARLFPPSYPVSNTRPPSSRRSPVPSRSTRNGLGSEHVNLPCAMPSAFENDAPMAATNEPTSSRRPRSPPESKCKQSSGRSTTKVRYVSKMVQCAYMENGDFIAKFSGGKVAMKKGNSADIVVAKDKKKAELTPLEEAHFQKVIVVVRALERVCETQCGVNATCDCFPVLVDKLRSSPQKHS